MSLSPEDAQLRREILEDLGGIAAEHLAGACWSRLLVSIVHGERGEPVVSDVDVEGITGDEAAVDAAFSSPALRSILPLLAKACEALAGLDGVDLAEVGGGTFLRQEDGTLAWLPGLLHMPSAALARAWESVTSRLADRMRALEAAHGLSTCTTEVDLAREHAAWRRDGRVVAVGRATLLGTLADATRTWGWGATSPHVPEAIRRASADVVDGLLERDLWELTTPAFPLDEGTARALAAFVCDRAGADGVLELADPGGRVFLLLRDVRAGGAGG